MQLPPLPLVPIDLNREEKEFITSLDEKVDSILVAGREADKLYVMGSRGRSLFCGRDLSFCEDSKNILGQVKEYVTIDRETTTGKVEVFSFQGPDYKTWKDLTMALATFMLYIAYFENSAARREMRSLQQAFHSKAMSFREQNLANIAEKIKPIRLYQGTLEEVERDLGRPLERVDTGKPETYIQKTDPFWLRVEAYLLGANAVAHYQPGSAIGTPVRFKEK